MKTFKEVESTRIQYYSKPMSNAVHRSSLIVPAILENEVELSLLNHFLIKRGYKDVTCKITAITNQGELIDSLDFPIEDLRVYTFSLNHIFASSDRKAAAYNIEFFSAKNFFIPYTAAMINHVGTGIVNQVHAYNRILNDVFEDDKVNAITVKEACIDVIKNEVVETFMLFNAGMYAIHAELEFELILSERKIFHKTLVVNVARFNSFLVRLSDIFPSLTEVDGGFLRVSQPKQAMFYGRLLCGLIDKKNNIVANHSYYDSSSVEEYWDDNIPSVRNYPFHNELELLFRIYPIISPGHYQFEVFVLMNNAKVWVGCETLVSPGYGFLEINVNKLINESGIDCQQVTTIQLTARNLKGKTPTRITHQLVYREMGGVKKLGSSINVSLFNSNTYSPKERTGRIWGQVVIGKEMIGCLAIATMYAHEKPITCQVTLYSDKGLFYTKDIDLCVGQSVWLTINDLVYAHEKRQQELDRSYIWYWITSDHPNIAAYSVTRHVQTGYITAEHSF